MIRSVAALTLLLLMAASPAAADADPAATNRLEAPRNLLTGVSPRDARGDVHVVVEIPAGTNAKWETTKDGSAIAWEIRDGRPRVVQYLPYPANYGMVPGTLLAEEDGGDGDPLDAVILGPARARGDVVSVRLIGVLRLLDDGDQDDKLVTVDPEGPFADVDGLEALTVRFPGVDAILETWFANYKGPNRISPLGWGDAAQALQILESAERSGRSHRSEAPVGAHGAHADERRP